MYSTNGAPSRAISRARNRALGEPRFYSSFLSRSQPHFASRFAGTFCKPAIRQFLPSREGFNYNTGHFGAGNTVARRVIKPASPRNCRQETYS
jgi:hypothetical protein